MLNPLYFVMQTSMPTEPGDCAMLYVPRSIDRESLAMLREVIDLQLHAIEVCVEKAEQAKEPNVSTPRPTDCADIREGRVTVLARDAETGEPRMTMVRK